MTFKLWNRIDPINGIQASHFLNQAPFAHYNGDIILIYTDNGKVSNVECKDILASVYELDKTLPLDDFMDAYFTKLEELSKEEAEVK